MDYSRTALADRLAAEHALGTLRGPARRRFDALLLSHPALRSALAAWQERLMPLATALEPVAPSPQVWASVERRVFGEVKAAAAPGWWQRLAVWRAVSALATVAALGLGIVASRPPPVAPPIVIVLDANPEATGRTPASFVASVTPDGRALVLRPIGAVALDAGRALELWSVPTQGAPRSLGIVSASATTTVLRARLLEGTAAFAVTLEPPGGSPTGAPTGPVVSVGKLQI